MKISIRKKVILSVVIFIGIIAIIWYQIYHSQYVLNQKIQIIERKNSLFNTILEARRYEKNFFLSFDKKNLEQALAYLREAENNLFNIIAEYGKYTLTKNLTDRMTEIKEYKKSLLNLLQLQNNGTLVVPQDSVALIQGQGHKITTEFEHIMVKEGQFIRKLVEQSQTIHFVALLSLVIFSILVALFLSFFVNRPLKTIENAIKKIVTGDFKNIPAISTGDEFESLVASLNNMIDELDRRNKQLAQAKKLASLGRLIAGVAHELNNPFNNISTSLQILIEEWDEDNLKFKKGLVINAEQEVVRGKNIIKSLLEFSMERSISFKWTNFECLVSTSIQRIKAVIPNNVKFNIEVPGDLQVCVDPEGIERVMINLILNAVQALEDGGEIAITAYPQEDKGAFCFQVQDTGCGIFEENIDKIFDPFFTTKEVGKGSGLGLSIVYGIIEQHGGKISVTSEQEKGTTISVFLPTNQE